MKELSAFDIHLLVQEVQFLVNSKVENIYQTDQKDLYLQIYVKDKPKQLLRIVGGKYFYLAHTRPEFPQNLQRFCGYLRKYLVNARIKAIEQVSYERILKISIDAKGETFELVAELFGKGNLILIKKEKILAVAEEQLWADRIVKPGEIYIYPTKVDTKVLFEKQKEKGSTISMESLEAEASKEATTKTITPKDKETVRLKTIIKKQEEQLVKIMKETDENRKKGEIIYNNYEELQKILVAFQGIKNKEEAKTLLKNYPFFKDVKEGTLVVNVE